MARYKLLVNEIKKKVDRSTGEITEVNTRKLIEVKLGKEEKFYMTFIQHISPIYELTYADDIKVLVKFCELAEYESGTVHLSPARRAAIVQELGLQQSNVSKSLRRLKEKRLITGENGEYTLNPLVFWKGDRNKRLEQMKNKGLAVTFNFMLTDKESEDGE